MPSDKKIPAISLRKRKKGNNLRNSTLPLHLMLLAPMLVVFIYSYLPMFGIVIAFQKYDFTKGLAAFWQSEWVGLGNFRQMIAMGEPVRIIWNTVRIAFLKIAIGFFVPIVVALMLNEVRLKLFKRSVQTIIYMPHFISWVLLAGIIKQVISIDGFLNVNILSSLGIKPISFLSSNVFFVPMLVGTDIWKEFGYGTIVYLAAITNVDPALYEAAVMDGASRWRQTWHITLTGMRPIIVLQMVLRLQGVLNAGFDQVFNMYNANVYQTADIIDTWVYRISFESATPMYDKATAIGLFKSLVSMVFILISYFLAYKVANYQIF